MANDKFSDAYERFFDSRDDFMTELHERQAETKHYGVQPEKVSFFSGTLDGDSMLLQRIEQDTVKTKRLEMTDDLKVIWGSPDTVNIGLFISFPTEAGPDMIMPVSQNCKLSLGNRARLTFAGDLDIPINKIALARMYEDLIKREKKKEEIQIISIYGKAQAVMTNVYSPIGHDEFFEKIDSKLTERFGKTTLLRTGYIAHKWSRGTWYIGKFKPELNEDDKRQVELGLSAVDSQTGHSGAVLQPCLFSGRKNRAMLFDDAWYSKHMALTEEGINEALESVYLTLTDNAQKLVETINIELKNPAGYARGICSELNKIAKKMSGTLIPAKTIKSFISSIEGLSFIRSNFSVWDVIEILWDIPENTAASTTHKDGLMKTVSRVLALNHTTLDVA